MAELKRSPKDIRAEALEMMRKYKDDPKQLTFSCLLVGEYGTGKTTLMTTARKPVHIDSFDPRGTVPIRPEVLTGDIVVDTRYEEEDPEKPFAFDLWREMMRNRIESGYFAQFSTYCLDSVTTMADSVMNKVMGGSTRKPEWDNYHQHKRHIMIVLKQLLEVIPCDVFVTGHLRMRPINEGASHVWRFMSEGQSLERVPMLFTEKWVMREAENKNTGNTEPVILTQNSENFQASTRIGRGKFVRLEKADVKHLLRKAGLPTTDKPGFKSNGK